MFLVYLVLVAVCNGEEFAIPPVTPAGQQVAQNAQGPQPIGSIAQQPVFANNVRFVQTSAQVGVVSDADSGGEAKKAEEKAEEKIKRGPLRNKS